MKVRKISKKTGERLNMTYALICLIYVVDSVVMPFGGGTNFVHKILMVSGSIATALLVVQCMVSLSAFKYIQVALMLVILAALNFGVHYYWGVFAASGGLLGILALVFFPGIMSGFYIFSYFLFSSALGVE